MPISIILLLEFEDGSRLAAAVDGLTGRISSGDGRVPRIVFAIPCFVFGPEMLLSRRLPLKS